MQKEQIGQGQKKRAERSRDAKKVQYRNKARRERAEVERRE